MRLPGSFQAVSWRVRGPPVRAARGGHGPGTDMAQPKQTILPHRRKSRVAATLKALVRTRITTGLLVVLPIYVTILLVRFVFGAMRDASRWVLVALLENEWFQQNVWQVKPEGAETVAIDEVLAVNPVLDWTIAIVSVILTIGILYAVGVFAANIFGRRIIDVFERVLDRVPLIKTVYRSSKQILVTFSGEQSREFQRVALIPFPQERMRCVGFITAIFQDSETGEELATVFIPTTPNPTTGYLQILKRKDLVELDWSVEDAVRTIMSGGILRPEYLTIVPTKERADISVEDQPDLPPPEPKETP
jgi:uncharacterized membrane protein